MPHRDNPEQVAGRRRASAVLIIDPLRALLVPVLGPPRAAPLVRP